jgi:hypothetical protein
MSTQLQGRGNSLYLLIKFGQGLVPGGAVRPMCGSDAEIPKSTEA